MDAARPRIVVGVDGSTGSRRALAAFPVEFSWTDPHLLGAARIDGIRADTETRARELVDEERRAPGPARPGDLDVSVHVCAGPPAPRLVQRSADADLLVVGARGRGTGCGTVTGTVALHCATHAVCPVLVLRPRRTG